MAVGIGRRKFIAALGGAAASWPLPNRKARLDPGPALLAVERCDLAVDPIPVDRSCELCQPCLRSMIWSSRARNRSPDFVVACFFGRIVLSDETPESCFAS
jgi:hypothetical protein